MIESYALSDNTAIIFLSETFLDSSIEGSDPNINISGYNSLRSDHAPDTERGVVCMFYKDYLLVIRRDDLCPLTECIVTKIKFGKKYIFLLATIDLRAKLQMNLRIIVKILTQHDQI